jgi:hypothetical protein
MVFSNPTAALRVIGYAVGYERATAKFSSTLDVVFHVDMTQSGHADLATMDLSLVERLT